MLGAASRYDPGSGSMKTYGFESATMRAIQKILYEECRLFRIKFSANFSNVYGNYVKLKMEMPEYRNTAKLLVRHR
jgi:hypothetical protein